MSELVSICIPAYNQVVFLKKTLDSISSQSYKNYEVVITDDSSNETVRELVETYQRKTNIRYHKNTVPLGSPANWNNALDLASGSLIKIMHHDDWFSTENSLQQFVDAFENKETDFAFCDSRVLDILTGGYSLNAPGPVFLDELKKDPKVLFNNNKIGSPTAVMFRTTLERFDEKMKYLVDIDFYIRLLNNNHNFHYIHQPLIVNTSNNADQVTAASMNKKTQVGEYCYLYNKHFNGKIPSIEQTKLFRYLFKQYGIKKSEDIRSLIGEIPKPTWYFKLMLMIG